MLFTARANRPTRLSALAAELLLNSRPGRARPGEAVLARLAARRSLRSAALWGYVFGIMVVSSALSYGQIYKTGAERRRLADAFGSNHAASALFGPAPQLQTVAGFTVYKVSMTLMIAGAVWGLLTSTRLLRAEEDSGRWELVLSGLTTRRRATAQVLAALSAAVAVLWGITAVMTIAVGASSSVRIGTGSGLYLALALVASAAMFIAVGALASQLAPSRRQAAAYAGAFLGLCYGVRMVGDSGTGYQWLDWVSPLGWVEQLRPLTNPEPLALVPIVAFTAATAALAVGLAEKRDVGSSLWPARAARPARLQLLSGPTSSTVRLGATSGVWWAIGLAAGGLAMGSVAKAAGTSMAGSSVQQVLARLGARGSGTSSFLGVSFVILAIVIAFEGASQLSAARAEEAEGRLQQLLAGPVSRTRWFSGRLVVASGTLLAVALVAGVGIWAGAATKPPGVGLGTALDASTNIVPPALVVLGVGALTMGFWPRRTGAVMYGALAWSAFIDLAGGFFTQDHWLADTSVFHQMASAPAAGPDWWTNAAMVGVALLAMSAGAASFARRDLSDE
ncbi:MAG TPA: ABC transporter permease subunit [Acidimicrobiales bacterium]|nr:ABC transporter permease subunit [Acidimicrobiales bacterium]